MPEVTATRVIRSADGGLEKRRRAYRLVVRAPSGEQREARVARELARIGSNEGNEIVLRDPAVSRLHAEIRTDDVGFRLRDLESRNGTFVEGMRVHDVYLRPGVVLGVGDTTLRFELLEDEVPVGLSPRDAYGPLVGRSPRMRELFALLERIAASDATALVVGESGSGKEGVARALHEHGARARGPYVVFDCAAVSGSLVESELFGHERGAFTGAAGARTGAVEEAEGGTLFLDEIGELPLDLQPKLLRLLEQREYRRVGSSRARQADVRVIAATHRDLPTMVNAGSFREDLYYRLAVVEVRVPPLRGRREDIPLLVQHLLVRATNDESKARALLDGISRDAWQRLDRHPWPGNVRELRNVVQRMLVLGAPPEPPSASPAAAASPGAELDLARPWMEQKRVLVERYERAYLEGVLRAQQGNITRAAEVAGIERMYFKRLLRKHGVE